MKKQLLILALVLLATQSFAQREVFVKSEQAINGYDPVAYFKEGKPMKGKSAFVYQWKQSNWFFVSAENLSVFKSDPEKYAPQFGGYCAYGMSEGHKAPTDAEAWTIVDGKLYLNYNKDVQKLWKNNQEECIVKANENWPTVKDKTD